MTISTTTTTTTANGSSSNDSRRRKTRTTTPTDHSATTATSATRSKSAAVVKREVCVKSENGVHGCGGEMGAYGPTRGEATEWTAAWTMTGMSTMRAQFLLAPAPAVRLRATRPPHTSAHVYKFEHDDYHDDDDSDDDENDSDKDFVQSRARRTKAGASRSPRSRQPPFLGTPATAKAGTIIELDALGLDILGLGGPIVLSMGTLSDLLHFYSDNKNENSKRKKGWSRLYPTGSDRIGESE
ncbi:hypothetical protein DFJ73DRAFT_774317 [Zopfochytrium polystomum]|nr:hypothetical protein DFJ73DRAFT_774317 [Zopfochytrium polystomum]